MNVLRDMNEIVKYGSLIALLFAIVFVADVARAQTHGEDVFCPAVYIPVCGLVEVQCVRAPCPPLMQTFGNDCELNARGAEFLHEGECVEDGVPHDSDVIAPSLPPTPEQESDEVGRGNVEPPADCRVWYDGCNTCSRGEPGGLLACTQRACVQHDTPMCREFFPPEEDSDVIEIDFPEVEVRPFAWADWLRPSEEESQLTSMFLALPRFFGSIFSFLFNR